MAVAVDAMEHQNLVHAVIRKHGLTPPRAMDYEDLFQEGMYGLCLAAQRYDPDRGVPFHIFAWFYIRGYILRAIRNHTKDPAHEAILMGSAVDEDGGELTYGDTTRDDSSEDGYDRVEQLLTAEKLHPVLEQIDPEITKLLGQGLSMNAVARELETTQPTIARRIRRIRRAMLKAIGEKPDDIGLRAVHVAP